MEPGGHIKSLLQFQLASDGSSVRSLPYCLSTLTSECFGPSSHLAKWTSRINSLMHAKEPGARWAGLCLAYKTSLFSQAIMIDCAQAWMLVALPALSRNEPLPVLKAALRLLRVIFTAALDIGEFQRQVIVPNVVKFTTAIISLADNHNHPDLKVICMTTLAHLVTLYPTTHRSSSANLSSFCLRYLSGSPNSRTKAEIMNAASNLFSVLHLTGGKVGSVNLWRKSLDETLAFGREAFLSLRTTFPIQAQQTRPLLEGTDPQIAIAINLDRLQCSVTTLCDLSSTLIHRSVHVPLGSLVNFSTTLLSCSGEDKIDGFVDPLIRSMEMAIIPEICSLGCDFLTCLAERFHSFLGPYLTRIFSILVFQLEQKRDSRSRLKLLTVLESLLKRSYVLESTYLCTRIAKVALPDVIGIVSTPGTKSDANEVSSNKTKNGKKRARNFEGEEVLKSSREVLCRTSEDREALLVSIDVLRSIFRNPSLSSAMASVIARVMVAALLILPRFPPSFLSSDPNFILSVTKKVQDVGFLIGSGTASVMSKALPFIIEAGFASHEQDVQKNLELLLHPRVPPLVRIMPHLESLSLFKAEESQEEATILSSHLLVEPQHPVHVVDDVDMQDVTSSTSVRRSEATASKVPIVLPQDTPDATPLQSNPLDISSKQTVEQPLQKAELSLKAMLPSIGSSRENGSSHAISVQRNPLPPPVKILPSQEEEEDEEMPVINMSSDSDIDEDE